MNNNEFETYAAQIEQLVQQAAALPDESARTLALELLQSTMDLHGAVMSRIVELLSEGGDSGRNSLAKLGNDPLVCGLLVLYGIHPVSLHDRVTRAVEKLGPQLHKKGGSIELLGIADNSIQVKILGSQHSCGSTPDSFRSIVEQAIRESAPEIAEIAIDEGSSSPSGFVPLNMIHPATNEEKKYEKSTV
jgi:Fe-S cluster biogenesis protein NfuA